MRILKISSIILLAITLLFSTSFTTSEASTSGGGGATRCWGADQVRTSASGSKIIMPGGNSSYGYCHIVERHMVQPSVSPVSVNGASQFRKLYSEAELMDYVLMDVINTQTKLVYTSSTRAYKEIYNMYEGKTVRVILHKGSDWSGLTNYDWVVVSAYPVF